LDCSAILYFETSTTAPHSIILYTDTGRHEFRGNLSQIQKGLDKRFFKCHRSIIVNADKVTEVDAAGLKLRLEKGYAVEVAAKYVKGLKKLMMRG
jgi:two-component system response regulator AgrA